MARGSHSLLAYHRILASEEPKQHLNQDLANLPAEQALHCFQEAFKSIGNAFDRRGRRLAEIDVDIYTAARERGLLEELEQNGVLNQQLLTSLERAEVDTGPQAESNSIGITPARKSPERSKLSYNRKDRLFQRIINQETWSTFPDNIPQRLRPKGRCKGGTTTLSKHLLQLYWSLAQVWNTDETVAELYLCTEHGKKPLTLARLREVAAKAADSSLLLEDFHAEINIPAQESVENHPEKRASAHNEPDQPGDEGRPTSRINRTTQARQQACTVSTDSRHCPESPDSRELEEYHPVASSPSSLVSHCTNITAPRDQSPQSQPSTPQRPFSQDQPSASDDLDFTLPSPERGRAEPSATRPPTSPSGIFVSPDEHLLSGLSQLRPVSLYSEYSELPVPRASSCDMERLRLSYAPSNDTANSGIHREGQSAAHKRTDSRELRTASSHETETCSIESASRKRALSPGSLELRRVKRAMTELVQEEGFQQILRSAVKGLMPGTHDGTVGVGAKARVIFSEQQHEGRNRLVTPVSLDHMTSLLTHNAWRSPPSRAHATIEQDIATSPGLKKRSTPQGRPCRSDTSAFDDGCFEPSAAMASLEVTAAQLATLLDDIATKHASAVDARDLEARKRELEARIVSATTAKHRAEKRRAGATEVLRPLLAMSGQGQEETKDPELEDADEDEDGIKTDTAKYGRIIDECNDKIHMLQKQVEGFSKQLDDLEAEQEELEQLSRRFTACCLKVTQLGAVAQNHLEYRGR
ncbi:hypothetical protein C1H76_2662 [Elsinoe australis]|uniref:Uncharacterized protein n=1 Tax=Elsinoe australis TaxID=40998 RepID=A0A4U7B8E4_9PEZI|nr:hypothetical protein C1H76_2662 [Elsinoe australis]